MTNMDRFLLDYVVFQGDEMVGHVSSISQDEVLELFAEATGYENYEAACDAQPLARNLQVLTIH